MQRSLLRNTRIKNKLTLEQTAKEIGISRVHLSLIETGIKNPSLDVACRLEKFFGIPVCQLFKKDGDEF